MSDEIRQIDPSKIEPNCCGSCKWMEWAITKHICIAPDRTDAVAVMYYCSCNLFRRRS